MKIHELMSSKVHTCEPHDSLASVAKKLLEHDCGALPVVDHEGRVGAVITDRDICIGAYVRGVPLSDLRVADSMSKKVVTCHVDDEVSVALQRMAEHQVHRLPVLDEHDKLRGILSLNDLAVVAQNEKKPKIGRGALRVLAAVSRHRVGVPAVAGKPHDVGATAEQT